MKDSQFIMNNMTKLTKVDVLLHKVGINTKAYKQYAYEMQRELDYEHLSCNQFIYKYCRGVITKHLDYNKAVELLYHVHVGEWLMYYHDTNWDFDKSYSMWIDEWRNK